MTARILHQMGFENVTEATPFHSAEDGAAYEVWKVMVNGTPCVLKKAKGRELDIYRSYFAEKISGAPQLLADTHWDGEDYLLMEYAVGEDLCRCDRRKLTLALDALMGLQSRYWGAEDPGSSFQKSLEGRKNRGKYLNDRLLEAAYEDFLRLYETLPRTLCHDDLLPFNVLAEEDSATIIDWECAGILPYPVSLARLIAHGSENEDAFFCMTEADKAFAIEYYYDNLIREKGIAYADYRRAVNHFLLYEYCEWIMLGNRYPDADMVRYRQYLKKAKDHLKNL